MTGFQKAIEHVEERLDSIGVESPKREALLMLSNILGLRSGDLYFKGNGILDARAETLLDVWIERRKRREPLQYITGVCEFYSLGFKVTPAVLIPRPETELLVEEAVGFLKDKKAPLVLDLCSGSGCVGISIASEVEGAHLVLSDLSPGALSLSFENARNNGVEERIDLMRGDLFGALSGKGFERVFDAVVTNPPYVRSGDIDGLEPEVRGYEPMRALDGGKSGLDFIRRIIKDAPMYLKEGGMLLMEFGFGQAKDVLKIANESGAFNEVSVIKDLSGIERVLRAKKAS